jgi:hypothetical protein
MYQSVKDYDGSLYGSSPKREDSFAGSNFARDDGYQYDYEVSNDNLIGSPGGVSATHHQPIGNIYGRSNTSSDIYAGQDHRYINGEYGGLYSTGQTASENLGYYPTPPDAQWWNNITPQNLAPYGMENHPSVTPPDNIPATDPDVSAYSNSRYITEPFSRTAGDPRAMNSVNTTVPQPSPKEGYAPAKSGKGVESETDVQYLVSQKELSDTMMPNTVEGFSMNGGSTKLPHIIILLLLLGLFIVFVMWSSTANKFIREYYFEGEKLDWKSSGKVALIATVVILFVLWVSGMPFNL